MVRVFVPILLAAICIQYTQAACDQKVIDKIKELRKGKDGSNPLDGLQGHYKFFIIYSGPLSALLGKVCREVDFIKTSEGKYVVEYNGEIFVKYEIYYKDGAVVLAENKDTLTYIAYSDSGVLGIHTCNKGAINFTFYAIAVNTAVDMAADKLEEAKETMTAIGAKEGVTADCKF